MTTFADNTTTATAVQAHVAIKAAVDALRDKIDAYEPGVTKGTNKAQLRREAEQLQGMLELARTLFPTAWAKANTVGQNMLYTYRAELQTYITDTIALVADLGTTKAVPAAVPFREAVAAFEAVQDKHAELGARDTEPRSEFLMLINAVANGTEPVLPVSARDWQLFYDMRGAQAAAKELTAAAKVAVQAAQADRGAARAYLVG